MSRSIKPSYLLAILCAFLWAPAGAAHASVIDRSFGGDGVVLVTASKEDWPEASALVVQPDGRVVLAAERRLVRYLPNGRRDPSFTQSLVPVDDLALGPGGSLVRVGDSTVERLREDGRPDRSFGSGDGRVTLPGIDLSAVAVRADGGIVAAGASEGRIAVVRLRPHGTLDPTFGSGGIVLTQVSEERFAPSADGAGSLALMDDGRIVVGASVGEDEASDCHHCWGPYLRAAVLRYLPDGTLDRTFGSGGVYRAVDEAWGSAESVLVRPNDGVAFAAGGSTGLTLAGEKGVGFTVVGLTPHGLLDPDSGRGWVSRSFLTERRDWFGPQAAALAAVPDGRILAAGGQAFPAGLMIERLRADGGHTRFGGHRFVRKRIADTTVGGAGGTAVALAPRRHFYVLGVAEHRVVLARFNY